MTMNVGVVDRIVRIAVGIALIAFALGYIAPGTGWNWLGWIGLVPLITAQPSSGAVLSFCGYGDPARATSIESPGSKSTGRPSRRNLTSASGARRDRGAAAGRSGPAGVAR